MLRKFAFLSVFSLSLVGCASVPMGDASRDAELKSFTPKPGVAGLYIYRNESMGAGVKMDVEVDGKAIGRTAAKTYLYTEVEPGTHSITSKAENTDTIQVNAAPGKLYYIWQEVKMGLLYARTKLTLMGEAEGQKGVRESSLAAGQ